MYIQRVQIAWYVFFFTNFANENFRTTYSQEIIYLYKQLLDISLEKAKALSNL